jgi:serine protease Do
LLPSCNSYEVSKENQLLFKKLEEKEILIRNQIQTIEKQKSEIRELNQKLSIQKEKQSNSTSNRNLSDLYNEVKTSVYLIYTQNEEGISQGSAFVVSKEGIAISNFHVFKNASKAIAINENGDEFLISEILTSNEKKDYIIFKLGPLTNPISFLKISSVSPKIGEDVFAVGNPKGLTQTLSEGIISGSRGELLQTTTEITNGSSGGPLFNNFGEVIGITSSGIGEANLNFAINIQTVDFKDYLALNENSKFNPQFNRSNLVTIMENYFSALVDGNTNTLYDLYENELSRYHSLYSISRSEAIKDQKGYLSKYKVQSVNIIQNTIEIFNGKEEYTVQFQIDYKIINKITNKPLSYILNTVCVINSNGKIKSIFDNILKKN